MTAPPARALVLAAGLGARLRPLTLTTPKPLLPLWNVPLIEHILTLLEGWGVREIAVNTHWRSEALEAYLARRRGVARIRVSFEPEILGTGGALRPLRAFMADEPFWVVNADIAVKVAAEPLLEAFALGDGLGAAWLEPVRGPRTVEADRRGRITCYRSPTPGVDGTYTFCGLQLLSPAIFDYLPQKPFCTLVEAYEAALSDARFIQGVVQREGVWDDAGTLEAYLRLHEAREYNKFRGVGSAPAEGEKRAGSFWVGAGARVARGARGQRSLVCGTARVQAGASLKNCIIAGGSVSGRLEGAVCVAATREVDEALPQTLAALGWKPAATAAQLLGERGSGRIFWRLHQGAERAIYIRYSLERAENGLYAASARLLEEAGVPVPRVLADLPQCNVLVLEDLGDLSLERCMREQPERGVAWYGRAVETLARLHRAGTARILASGLALNPPFDAALYAWERALCAHHLLAERFGIDAWPAGVEAELLTVAERLLQAPQVVLHRDFQSSNILLREDGLALIDFQGLRLGAAAYDLASLLYDPYVALDEEMRLQLARAYAQLCPEALTEELLHLAATQRLVQALGAFGRLAASGQREFARHVLPALVNLLAAADHCGLDAVGGMAEELIAREQALISWAPPL